MALLECHVEAVIGEPALVDRDERRELGRQGFGVGVRQPEKSLFGHDDGVEVNPIVGKSGVLGPVAW